MIPSLYRPQAVWVSPIFGGVVAFLSFKHESASAKLNFLSEYLTELVSVEASILRQGHGTGLMNEIIRYADREEVTILLKIQAYGPIGCMDNRQLESFYGRFGFVKREGPRRPVGMIRFPS